MKYEQIAHQVYDELSHNRLVDYEEYIDRICELLRKSSVPKDKIQMYLSDIETIMHNKWSFGFCDMCGEVIFYDTDTWYDLEGPLYDYERARIKQNLPRYLDESADVSIICLSCFNKLVKGVSNE